MNKYKNRLKAILIICILTSFYFFNLSSAQEVSGTLEKHIQVGELQSHFTAYGAERAWNNVYYAGMQWPADYPYTDNSVIERAWLATENFTDTTMRQWTNYGIYITAGYVGESIFPVKHKLTAKFAYPKVYVDGIEIKNPYEDEVDVYDPSIVPDRIVDNVINTSMGLTMRRKIFAFSQQYHDDYFIKEYTFINTGNVDYDDEIELDTTATLYGVRISWGVRYAVSREGATKYDRQQSWGKYTWVTRRGEDYASHINDPIAENVNPILSWLRCGFAWAGQSDRSTAWDNIGAPDKEGNGRLCSPQMAGTVILHVDKSVGDNSDDPDQPVALGWHAGDTYPSLGDMEDEAPMVQLYNMMSGNPHGGQSNGGTNRFYEDNTNSITDPVSPYKIHGDGGGTNIWICYGPFDIPHGDSIKIVEAEAVNGLSRDMCERIGTRWVRAYNDPSDTGPFELPPSFAGGPTNDKDYYKNAWFYTGWDSIMLTFSRAKRSYELNYNIPQPPLPPEGVDINSGGDRITISWQPSPSENESDFAGYKIYRAVGKPDTSYEEIYSGAKGIYQYEDLSPIRGFAYYYYVVAFNDGGNNGDGFANPTGILQSGRFYTRTTEPAYLRRPAGRTLDDIVVVPNPYNIKARAINFPGESNKIGFYNIPAICTIKIFTERGDLIYTIDHTDGSGDDFWNLITSSRQVVVSGVYIAYFEVTEDYIDQETQTLLYKKGDNKYVKFVVIR